MLGGERSLYVPMMMQAIMRPPRARYSGDGPPKHLTAETAEPAEPSGVLCALGGLGGEGLLDMDWQRILPPLPNERRIQHLIGRVKAKRLVERPPVG